MNRLADILSRVEQFVELRKKEGGGFGATPNLPATVEDTYHALRILDSISSVSKTAFSRQTRRWPELSSFLHSFLKKDLELGARGVFQLFWCMKYCRALPPERQVLAVIGRKILDRPGRENLYFALRTMLEVLESTPGREAILPGTPPAEPIFEGILRKRMMDLYLDRHLGWGKIPAGEAAAWFRLCQNPDGGFGFMPGTTSYIENCHYGLSSLALLDSAPADKAACQNFIMGCRTRSGGFSRNSSAAPFLDATWHAVRGLLILKTL